MMTTAQIVHMATLPPQDARAYMRECNMTSEERERHLYIAGRTVEAALVGCAIDEADDELDSMRHERDEARKKADDFEAENDTLRDDLATAEEKVLTLTSSLENAEDEVKDLQIRLREAGLDLV